MKKMIDIILAVLTLLAMPAVGYAGEESLRDRLVSDSGVRLLYPVDEYHTFIAGVPVTGIGNNGAAVVKRYIDPSGENRFEAFLLRHDTPQPPVYKSAAVDKGMTVLPARVGLAAETFNGEKSGLTALDLFTQANIVCRAKKGAPSYVITKRYGQFKRLTRVGAAEAFGYILLAENTGDTWLMACDGKEKFLVEKNYRVMNNGGDAADIYSGTALEGVSYVENGPYAEDLFAQGPVKEASPAEKAAFMEGMARTVAAMKMDFVRPYKGISYSGAYSQQEGCDRVSIRHSEGADSRTIVSEFSVCSGHAASIGESVIKETASRKRIALVPVATVVANKADR